MFCLFPAHARRAFSLRDARGVGVFRVSWRFRRVGQKNFDARALSFFTFDLARTAVQFAERTHQRESETGAGVLAGVTIVDLFERLKDALKLLARDAAARVFDNE